MALADTPDMLRGRPVSHTNMYNEDYRTHDEYQYRIKDKVRMRTQRIKKFRALWKMLTFFIAPQELLEAAKKNEMKRARLMIDDQANPLVADMGGFTALYFAALNGHADMCRLLMEHGATFPEEGSEKGVQLKGYCLFYEHAEALALLEAAWAAARAVAVS